MTVAGVDTANIMATVADDLGPYVFWFLVCFVICKAGARLIFC